MTSNTICYFLFLQLVLSSTIAYAQEAGLDQFQDLVDHITNDDSIEVFDFIDAVVSLDTMLQNQDESQANVNKYMGQILNQYAKALFYGKFNKDDPEIQKALYFFKLASSYGNSESIYYLSFYSFYNLDGRFLYENNDIYINASTIRVRNYIKEMTVSLPITSVKFSGIKKSSISRFLMGNIFSKGIGVKENCKAAASYFEELAESFSQENEVGSSYIFEKNRLDELYYHRRRSGIEESDRLDKDPLEELTLSDLDSIDIDLLQARIHYERGDFKKAYKLFVDLANQDNIDAVAMTGYMLVNGIGADQDVQGGLNYLKTAALNGSLKAKNMLGMIYYSAKHVDKDEALAIKYLKEAAYASYADAQYNYGILLFEKGEDKETALDLFESAASQGHSSALFHLGFALLEEGNSNYNCELGVSMLKKAYEKGPWFSKLQDAFIAYKINKNVRLASIYYMEAALLGYDIASPNGALLINKFHPFTSNDVDIEGAKKSIAQDPLSAILEDSVNFKLSQNLDEFLHYEVLQVLKNLGYKTQQKEEILRQLTTVSMNTDEKYNDHVVVRMLSFGVKAREPLSLMKLGDLYYEGVVVEQNYTKAYEYYSELRQQIDVQADHKMLPQVLGNLAYMNHYGLGKSKNLTEAINFYSSSLDVDKTNYYFVSISLSFAEWEKTLLIDVKPMEYYSKALDLINNKIEDFEQHYAKRLFGGFLMLAVFILYLFKMRLENYNKACLQKKQK